MVDIRLRIEIEESGRDPVSAILTVPETVVAGCVLGHGAGAGMQHEFMGLVTKALASRGVSVLRYNFPYMQAGRRAPDRQAVLLQTVRAAVAEARGQMGDVPLFAGGKSMGGRMTSIAQSKEPLPDINGLVFLGFPLHAAGRPGVDRAAHLDDVDVPLLFVQGSRDRLADIELIRSLVEGRLRDRAELAEIQQGDHSLRVPKRVGRTQAEILDEAAEAIFDWMSEISLQQ